MEVSPLSVELTRTVLTHLGVTAVSPSLSFLDQLMAVWCRTVPWETAFRINKRARTPETADCPRWPDEFWHDNLHKGGGGTCFESNYAFFSLLRALGFEGYLTINNMGESVGCHTAAVVWLNGQKWLADVGIPLYAPLPISPHGVMRRASQFQIYTVRPDGEDRYQIERHPHPFPYIFTLIDQPVSDAAYRAATTADYGEHGLFLDKLVVNKVVEGQPWRFNSAELPWRLNRFEWGKRFDREMEGVVETAVSHHFGLDEETVRVAIKRVTKTSEVFEPST